MMGVGQLRWQCYCRHQQYPQPCPDNVVLAGEEKKEEFAKPRTEGKEVSYGRIYSCGCNSGSPLRDAVCSKNRTHPPLEQSIT